MYPKFLLALCVLINAGYCHAHESVATPADTYGELFQRVQIQKVFSDGKSFVDAIPKQSPIEIMKDFSNQNPNTPEQLRLFVTQHFELPSTESSKPLDSIRRPINEHITELWPQLTRPAILKQTNSSALALPEPFVVPGGRFREMYYWDSYFTMLGLAADGRDDLVESMLANFVSLVDRYGHIPNGTRSYYLSRSQPPFFALMVRLSKTKDQAQLQRYSAALQKEHDYWMKGSACITDALKACERVVKMPDGSLLNRYWDDRATPREESYAEDVATAARSPRPAAETYRHLRAGAESGWDFSSRWLVDPTQIQTIHTTDIVPIDLNSLLWAQEIEISHLCKLAKDSHCATAFAQQAKLRANAIHKYLWINAQQRFADVDFNLNKPTEVLSAATLFPLFVGLATQDEAKQVVLTTKKYLIATGGLRTTQNRTGQQWDTPNGWAPLQWIAVKGLTDYGNRAAAKEIAKAWLNTVVHTYQETGKLLEKYDVEEQLPGGGGEYPLQDGFGWTNGVHKALKVQFPELASPQK